MCIRYCCDGHFKVVNSNISRARSRRAHSTEATVRCVSHMLNSETIMSDHAKCGRFPLAQFGWPAWFRPDLLVMYSVSLLAYSAKHRGEAATLQCGCIRVDVKSKWKASQIHCNCFTLISDRKRRINRVVGYNVKSIAQHSSIVSEEDGFLNEVQPTPDHITFLHYRPILNTPSSLFEYLPIITVISKRAFAPSYRLVERKYWPR
mmetsp:Transcript_26362/g.67218  ORF Transcript_26362/g.67218 Transcript_26362/m.67218 type:complete len:205 (+) Transcript_26362:2297-2911(+)